MSLALKDTASMEKTGDVPEERAPQSFPGEQEVPDPLKKRPLADMGGSSQMMKGLTWPGKRFGVWDGKVTGKGAYQLFLHVGMT